MINFKFIFVFLFLIVSGCCMLNNKKDGNIEFERQMNSLIGKPIGEGYHSFTLEGYKKLNEIIYKVIDYNGQKVYQRINQSISEPDIRYEVCNADFFVNVDTGLIAGWYYYPGANPEYCVRYEHRCW